MKQRHTRLQENFVQMDSANAEMRARGSRLGQFYLAHLKKYPLFELLIPWIWGRLYDLYRFAWILVFGKRLRRPLLHMSTFATTSGKTVLSIPEIVATPFPAVFPQGDRRHLTAPDSEYEFPAIYIADISDAAVTGGTNLIIADTLVICHDLYDFTRDYTSEELHWRTYIWPNSHQIAWLMSTTPVLEFDRAACFTDACAFNYAHWITEVLPRINLFCRAGKLPDVPILVDEGLHKNLMESLRAVTGDSREIVILPKGVCARVQHLAHISVAGYVPFERRSNRLKNHSHGRFSPFALQSLRYSLAEKITTPSSFRARRVFIKRNSGLRNIINGYEIEELLIAHGFSVVEPEQLTFAQQVALFSDADVVVGATGAAMANLIFCKPTTKIIILISCYRHTSYWYWQNMACAIGNRINYVLGKTTGIAWADIHSDYHVNPSDLLDAIGDGK
jgi:capsular polysaccharide biosynthesis protein